MLSIVIAYLAEFQSVNVTNRVLSYGGKKFTLTSRISLILLPPLPITHPAKLWWINIRRSYSPFFCKNKNIITTSFAHIRVQISPMSVVFLLNNFFYSTKVANSHDKNRFPSQRTEKQKLKMKKKHNRLFR